MNYHELLKKLGLMKSTSKPKPKKKGDKK